MPRKTISTIIVEDEKLVDATKVERMIYNMKNALKHVPAEAV